MNRKLFNYFKWPLLLFLTVAAGLWFLGDWFESGHQAPDKIYAEGESISLAVIPEKSTVEIRGLSPGALDYLEENVPGISDVLSVYAISEGKAWDESTIPSDGSWSISDNSIVFKSRYPWLPDVNYYAQADLGQLNALLGQTNKGAVIDTSFTITRPADLQPEHVTDVYPSADSLPQNLLKFYVYFSGPMSRENVYDHIRILNQDGEEVPDAFLKLPQELWDPGTTRLTILLDPGRIKRGLESHNMLGAAFEPGKFYSLLIDSSMVDGNGLPMNSQFKKSFYVTDPDREMPDYTQWAITRPPAGSREPLELQLDESLDYALLHRLITVKQEGETLSGKVETQNDEQLWTFTPDDPWQEGNYELQISAVLEDLAGNNLRSVFDVDLSDSTGERQVSELSAEPQSTVSKSFEIRSPD